MAEKEGKPISIEMGALAPSLQDQLEGVLPEIELLHFDKEPPPLHVCLFVD